MVQVFLITVLCQTDGDYWQQQAEVTNKLQKLWVTLIINHSFFYLFHSSRRHTVFIHYLFHGTQLSVANKSLRGTARRIQPPFSYPSLTYISNEPSRKTQFQSGTEEEELIVSYSHVQHKNEMRRATVQFYFSNR